MWAIRTTFGLPILLSVLALHSCATPEYWVKGLTLPPGSTVVSKTERTSEGNLSPMQTPLIGKMREALNVDFICPGGWDTVVAHIDSCMDRTGYTEKFLSNWEMAGQAPGGPVEEFMNRMRMYSKPGSQYTVTLTGMGDMMDAVGGAGVGIPGMGDFQLMVMKVK